jgi:hypothetical protein
MGKLGGIGLGGRAGGPTPAYLRELSSAAGPANLRSDRHHRTRRDR